MKNWRVDQGGAEGKNQKIHMAANPAHRPLKWTEKQWGMKTNAVNTAKQK